MASSIQGEEPILSSITHSAIVKDKEASTPGGTLIRLPLELRDMIYRLVLPDGHLDILLVSNFINAEATAMLYKVRTCVMEIGWRISGNTHDHRSRPGIFGELVQNYELRMNIDLGYQFSYLKSHKYDFKPLMSFGDANICRKSMVIKLDLTKAQLKINFKRVVDVVFKQLWCLVGFEIVVIKILGDIPENKNTPWTHIKKKVREILDSELGPAVCSDEEAQCIEYQPWKFFSHRCRLFPESWASDSGTQRRYQHTRFTYLRGEDLGKAAIEKAASRGSKQEDSEEQERVSENNGTVDGSGDVRMAHSESEL